MIQRSVIANRVDAVKTKKSKARLPLDPALIEVLRTGAKSQTSRLRRLGVGFAMGGGAMPLLHERHPA